MLDNNVPQHTLHQICSQKNKSQHTTGCLRTNEYAPHQLNSSEASTFSLRIRIIFPVEMFTLS